MKTHIEELRKEYKYLINKMPIISLKQTCEAILKDVENIKGFIGYAHKGHVTKKYAAELMGKQRDKIIEEIKQLIRKGIDNKHFPDVVIKQARKELGFDSPQVDATRGADSIEMEKIKNAKH